MTYKSDVTVEHTLESTWALQAPLEQVWKVLSDLGSWQVWWPAIEKIQVVRPGRDDGVEAIYLLNGNSELRVCEVRPPEMLECHTEQVLCRFTLQLEEGNTFLHVSVWGYPHEDCFRQVMSQGARGMAQHLGVRLTGAGSWRAISNEPLFP
jgi:uncharacterized protein YndB with AHSA1/START domain